MKRLLAAATILALCACSPPKRDPPPKPFIGTKWQVQLELPIDACRELTADEKAGARLSDETKSAIAQAVDLLSSLFSDDVTDDAPAA